MRNNDFTGVFETEVEQLDMYFHKALSKARLFTNFEDRKNELIQQTAFQVLLKLQKEKYNDYGLKSLIWLKAPDVWKNYIKSNTRKTKTTRVLDEEKDECAAPVPVENLEKHDFEKLINFPVPQDVWDVLVLQSKGYKYHEIASELKKSAGAMKTTVSSLKTTVSRFRTDAKNNRDKNTN